jgi:hypothetical protein
MNVVWQTAAGAGMLPSIQAEGRRHRQRDIKSSALLRKGIDVTSFSWTADDGRRAAGRIKFASEFMLRSVRATDEVRQ